MYFLCESLVTLYSRDVHSAAFMGIWSAASFAARANGAWTRQGIAADGEPSSTVARAGQQSSPEAGLAGGYWDPG